MIWFGRTEFLGVNVTPEVKEALKKKAANERTSMSRLAYDLLKKVLGVHDKEPE